MNPSPSPNFALLTSVDFSQFNAKPFSRGATAISAIWSSDYEDMISFLNGRGMANGKNLPDSLLASSNFGTNWHIGINANDKIEISSTHAFRIRFDPASIYDDDTDALGIGADWVLYDGSATIGSPLLSFKVTAPSDWIRGEVIAFSYEIEEVGSGSGAFLFNFSGGVQDLIVACRERGNGDIDDLNTATLEGADVAATSGDTRWYIDNNGHVVNSSIGITALTWNSSALNMRNFLGFTGDESSVYVNGYTVLTATHSCNTVLVPSRPYQQNHVSTENVAQSKRRIGGGYTSNYIGTYKTTVLGFDLDANLDLIDLYQHFIYKFFNYASAGERVNFYQVWGDSRRMLISGDVLSSQPAHDLVYTSSRNGFEGRIRACMISKQLDLSFPRNLRRRVPVTIRMEHLNE